MKKKKRTVLRKVFFVLFLVSLTSEEFMLRYIDKGRVMLSVQACNRHPVGGPRDYQKFSTSLKSPHAPIYTSYSRILCEVHA